MEPLFGDIHNHCGISYGHGSLEEALSNAEERLDFCSVTGHAFWPDMPEKNDHNRGGVEYHEEGFSRLRDLWPEVLETLAARNIEGEFVTYPGFEMHSNEYGDHTVIYRDHRGDILYADGLPDLKRRLAEQRERGIHGLTIPHHIGYRRGQRGINWDAFTPEFAPVVEIISMHGCSERDGAPHRFLHTMGPSDHESTMAYGLEQGHVFGCTGSTDHHSAHPGSYGHGLTGVWATSLTREAIWEAINRRRTWALTGDRIILEFSVNGVPMGGTIETAEKRSFEMAVKAGGPIDYIDLVKNNRILERWSPAVSPRPEETGEVIHTLLYLEVGWGPRGKRHDWDVEFGIDSGEILSVESRFRGLEVVSPLDGESEREGGFHFSHWEMLDPRRTAFQTVTTGNPTNSTNAGQGLCLEVMMPRSGRVVGRVGDIDIDVPVEHLIEGARATAITSFPTPSFLLHRAPLPSEFIWSGEFRDNGSSIPHGPHDTYYLRVRQQNDQWAWGSPVFVR